ncbi:MAG: type II toxin-antitoxin system RelB/DinJ family antitoxin [Oscillospiraceae bacterium]|nr:type II toxin-antitoxin system RelB/DinJ family antitoxin [Oscillospiraceae bacterium]
MSQVHFRIDDGLKEQAEKLFNALGLNMGIALNMFISQAVREQRIPFDISLYSNDDPYYSTENMDALKKALEQIKDGKVVVKTMDELLEMEK